MSIRAVYFNPDVTDIDRRAAVLRTAGYAVNECSSIRELADCLSDKRCAELVCIANGWNLPAEGALAVAHALSGAPIVLFGSSGHNYSHRSWDLQVLPLTPPAIWLASIAELLAHPRAGSRRP